MSVVIFKPFVGDKYSQQRVRLLVVGNSHYTEEPSDNWAELTRNTVGRWASGQRTPGFSFFTKLASTLENVSGTEIDRQRAFDRISFFNFFQAPMGSAREIPPDALSTIANAALHDVCADLRPTHIVVLGRQVWRLLPEFSGGQKLRSVEAEHGPLALGGRTVWAMQMTHPSSSFSPPHWHPILASFLAADAF